MATDKQTNTSNFGGETMSGINWGNVETEAAIYCEGTNLTKSDLIAAYRTAADRAAELGEDAPTPGRFFAEFICGHETEAKLTDLIPEDAQYTVDGDLATVTVDVGDDCLHVTARLTVVGEGDDALLAAEYVSHEWTGECEVSQKWIDYALRVIETNDYGVQS